MMKQIQKEYKSSRYISIIFNKDVKFVDPFFLILLLQYRKHTNKFLVLDTYSCTNIIEGFIINFLTQQIQFLEIKIENIKPMTEETFDKREEVYKSNFDISRRDEPSTYLYAKKDILKSNLQDNFCKNSYRFLPILSLTNETKNTIDYNQQIFEDKITKNCRDFYRNISIDFDETNNIYKTNLYSAIHQVLGAIEKPKYQQSFEKKDFLEQDFNNNLELLNKDLENIFFELIDNIKRHTKTDERYSNAYISSRYNDGFKRYEFIISDDYELGFIKSFEKTLKDNLNKLPPELLKNDKNIEKKYKVAFDKISTKKVNTDIEILDGLFGIKDTFGIREIQRLTMHFGIPMLMNLLKKLQGVFDIYVHHEDRYYHVSFDGRKETSPKVTALEEDNIFFGVRGTHIYISFPKNGLEKYLRKKIIEPTKHKLTIKNETFKNIFKEKNIIQKQVDSFKYIKIQNLEKELFDLNKYSYIILQYTEKEKGNNYFKGSISDFFRAVFAYSLFHNTQDIYIYNFPINDYKDYIAIIVEKIYKDITDKSIKLPNIIFQNKDSFDIAFIGGDCIEELKSINEHISVVYNQTNIFKDISANTVEPKIYDNSKLFFKLGKKFILLPFVLFRNKCIKVPIIGSIMREYLEGNSLKIHVDTKKGYHIDKLFQFSNLFSDSQWINRIAFVLASYGDSNTVFIGTDKYTSLIIAIANSFCANENYLILDNLQNNQGLIKNFIEQNSDKEFIVLSAVNFSCQDKNKYIINNLIDSENLYQNFSVVKINTEDVYSDCKVSSITNLYLVKNKDYYKVDDNSTCSICATPSKEQPLYELDESNVFSVKNFYRDRYTLKPNSSPPKSKKINSVNWQNSIHFVHAKRGNNHYTFYTKTINFFKQNELAIKQFFKKTINSDISEIVNNRKVIIFAPRHNTNNNFITYVDKYLFNNDATIYRFEKEYGEKNFYDLDFIGDSISDRKKTAIFFVDDEISSGYTMEYFYTLLRVKGAERKFDASLTMIDRVNINDIKVICNYVEGDSFKEKVDRLYSFTRLEIKPIKAGVENCFLCEKQEEYGKLLAISMLDMNRFQIAERIVKLNTTDAYTIDDSMEYENLKTGLKTYLKMYAVDFVYREFDAFHTMAQDHISENTNIEALHEAYITLEDKLYQEVITYLKIYFLKIGTFGSLVDSIFERICKYEINIALLKAISFPKLAYFHDIRNIATKIIICRLRSKIRESDDVNYAYCSREGGQGSKKIQKEIIQTMFNKTEKIALFKQPLTEELKDFFKEYEDKNNLHYINFLYITAAYLDIHAILDLENIQFYYHISHDVKKNNYEHKLLHIYPTAIKLLTEKYIDKSRYFDQQLLQFYCNELNDLKRKDHCHIKHGKTFSLVNALFLENIKIYSEDLPQIEDLKVEEKLNKLINNIEFFCKTKFQEYTTLEKHNNRCDSNPRSYTTPSANVKIEKIYINEHMERSYTSYIEYLEDGTLRDLTHDMKVLDANDAIYPLYIGAISDPNSKCSHDFIPIYDNTELKNKKKVEEKRKEEKKQGKNIEKWIDCSWSNGWIEYEIDNKIKKCTIIRLVEVNYQKLKSIPEAGDIKENNNLWYKPIGLIVVSHDGDYSTHLVYSRLLLSLQKYIVDFFKEGFDYGRFQEIIETKYALHYQKIKEELKLSQKDMEVNSVKKAKEKVLDILSKISHSYGRFIGIGKSLDKLYTFKRNNHRVYSDLDILNFVKNYTNGLQYIFQTGKLDESSGLKRANVSSFLDNEFKREVENFLIAAPLFFANDVDYKIENRIKIKHNFKLEIINDFEIVIGNSIENFKTIIFELIFNAIKKNADESIEILIRVDSGTIIVANTGKPIDNESTIFHEGGDGSGAGIGLFRVHRYLKSIKIDINTSRYLNFKAVFAIKERN